VLSQVTGNGYFDVAGTALIGLLLVTVAIVLAIETKSLLIGESATAAAEERITAALQGVEGIERVVHLRTMHLGPDELLVAAKIAVPAANTAVEVARAIDAAEVSIRDAEPIARVIYLEPDIARR
jgi:divalent metal cation (Fe/Co/Zn/Cd) transporter